MRLDGLPDSVADLSVVGHNLPVGPAVMDRHEAHATFSKRDGRSGSE